MRAARWHGPGDIRVEEIPVPTPAPQQALVRVDWCGICGTDLEEYRHGPVNIPTAAPHPLTGRMAPLVLGHEVVGTVVQAAADGSGFPAGTRVIPDTIVGCGSCWWCLRHQEGLCARMAVLGLHGDGGLAEYMTAAGATQVPVPETLATDLAALAEPVAVAVRAVRKAPDPLGASLLVVGAGTIGLLVTQVARLSGFGTIVAVDPRPERRALALAQGADLALLALDLALIVDATRGIGPDVAIECSGAPGLSGETIRATRRGGTAVLVGFHGKPEPLDLLDAILGEKIVRGSAAHLWDEDVATAIDLLARGRIDGRPLITARIPLADVVLSGFETLGNPAAGALKILVSGQ